MVSPSVRESCSRKTSAHDARPFSVRKPQRRLVREARIETRNILLYSQLRQTRIICVREERRTSRDRRSRHGPTWRVCCGDTGGHCDAIYFLLLYLQTTSVFAKNADTHYQTNLSCINSWQWRARKYSMKQVCWCIYRIHTHTRNRAVVYLSVCRSISRIFNI